MKLLSDRVAVIVDVIDNSQTTSGIILAQAQQQQPNTGVIAFVGNGRVLNDGKIMPVTVTAGDKIVFNPFSGTKIHLDGQEYLILREGDVLGVL